MQKRVSFLTSLLVLAMTSSCSTDTTVKQVQDTVAAKVAITSDSVLSVSTNKLPESKLDTLVATAKSVPPVKKETLIINSDFVFDPFCIKATEENIAKIVSKGVSITKSATENHYDDQVIDTIFTAAKNKSKILFYKAKDKFMLEEMDIKDKGMAHLCHGIDIGSSKSQFVKALGGNGNQVFSDTVYINNDEMERKFIAVFKYDKLKSLRLFPY